jgi:transcription elongation factor GreA
MIQNAVIIQEDRSSSGRVQLGSTVVVQGQDGEKDYYTVVGSAEADPSQQRISNESPVGSALMGKRKGDKVKVETPAGVVELKVVEVK